jgi:hypothetical protein
LAPEANLKRTGGVVCGIRQPENFVQGRHRFSSNYSWLARFQSVETKNQGFELTLGEVQRNSPVHSRNWPGAAIE